MPQDLDFKVKCEGGRVGKNLCDRGKDAKIELKFQFGPLPAAILTCTLPGRKKKAGTERVLNMTLGGNAEQLEYFAYSTRNGEGMPPFIAMRFKPSKSNELDVLSNTYEQVEWDAGNKFTEKVRLREERSDELRRRFYGILKCNADTS